MEVKPDEVKSWLVVVIWLLLREYSAPKVILLHSNPKLILDYNTTNSLNLPSDNNEEDISPVTSKNSKEKIRPTNINNNKKDIRLADIDKEKPAIPNWMSQNGLLIELSLTFKEVTFNEYKFPAGILVLDTRFKHPGSQNNNFLYNFNDQLDYLLAHYFANSETTKCNIDKFITNLLMKPITKDLSYCNADE